MIIQYCKNQPQVLAPETWFTLLALWLFPFSVIAQTHIFVQNDTPMELNVVGTEIGGGKLNKKAWEAGANTIAPNERKSVLKINRTGKSNWMDPTPRYIEPGTTIIFTTTINTNLHNSSSTIQLMQKLLGVGKSTKMWQSVSVDSDASSETDWINTRTELSGVWRLNNTTQINYSFRAF